MDMASAMETPEKRMKEAVDALMDELEKSHLRRVHKEMLSCSSSCYDMDFKTNRDIVADCIEHCNKPVRNISNFMQNELDTLQAQLNRCALTCYDKAYQKYGPDPATYNATEKKAYNKQIESCICACVDDHIKLLPNIRKRIVDTIKREKE